MATGTQCRGGHERLFTPVWSQILHSSHYTKSADQYQVKPALSAGVSLLPGVLGRTLCWSFCSSVDRLLYCFFARLCYKKIHQLFCFVFDNCLLWYETTLAATTVMSGPSPISQKYNFTDDNIKKQPLPAAGIQTCKYGFVQQAHTVSWLNSLWHRLNNCLLLDPPDRHKQLFAELRECYEH